MHEAALDPGIRIVDQQHQLGRGIRDAVALQRRGAVSAVVIEGGRDRCAVSGTPGCATIGSRRHHRPPRNGSQRGGADEGPPPLPARGRHRRRAAIRPDQNAKRESVRELCNPGALSEAYCPGGPGAVLILTLADLPAARDGRSKIAVEPSFASALPTARYRARWIVPVHPPTMIKRNVSVPDTTYIACPDHAVAGGPSRARDRDGYARTSRR